MEDFAAYVASETARLHRLREISLTAKAAAEAELVEIDNELRAVAAYQAARAGKPVSSGRAPRGSNNGAQRRRRGSRREEIARVVSEHAPYGLKRSEILHALGVKGDKSGEMSVSNALNAMLKANQLVRAAGLYQVASETF